jgi:hypothetical protein
MRKIENGQASRVLRDDELTLVSGGFHDVEERGFMNPALIRGFNPQPDPPGMTLVG